MIGRTTATGLATALIMLSAARADAAFRFIEANTAAGITDTGETFGTAWVDLNADGYPDIWLGKHQYTPTVIYLNKGDGTFQEYIEDFDQPAGLLAIANWDGRMDTHGVGSADFDNDGDFDVLEVTGASWDLPIWINNGKGRLINRFPELGFKYPFDPDVCSSPECLPIGGRSPVWLDYNDDGNLDVMVAARYTPTYVYLQPSAFFRQEVTADGSRTFVYDDSTGVDYASLDNCDYGVLAELSGDDRLDLVCGSTTRIEKVWDTSQRPFLDLRPQMGDAVQSVVVPELAVGDFNGDLRTDFFAPRGSYIQTVADTVGTDTVHALFKAAPRAEGEISFRAEGNLLIDFDWSTSVSEVFLGAKARHPPLSADISVYNGWGNHVQLNLSPTDFRNSGLATGTAGGVYIGRAGGRWYVRFVTPNQAFGDPGIAIKADVSITGLRSEGGVDIGQPADAAPALLLQNAAHQLVPSSSRITGPRSSCLSATSGDFDNDGDLDVYVGCTGQVKNLDNILYENDGVGNFTAITGSALRAARGDIYGRTDAVLTADYDLDGRLDLLVTNGNFPRPYSYSGRQQLFRNVSPQARRHWVEIDLEGVLSNRDGIGARIFATTPDGKVQLREQGNGTHRYTQNHQRIHLGLADNRTVDLEVRWPSGVVDHFGPLDVDQLYRLVEGTGRNADGIGVWRPASTTFLLDANGNFRFDPAVDISAPFGISSDVPIVGDWNGDGIDDIGAWRASTSSFLLDVNGNRKWDAGVDVVASFGSRTDVPVVGDWNGDGIDEIGVRRASAGSFFLDINGDRAWNASTDVVVPFGISGDLPVVGDWNGDGTDDIGVWRPSAQRFLLDANGNRQWDAGIDVNASFGLSTDVPLAGDWNGDGIDEIGVWRPSASAFLLDINGNHAWDAARDFFAIYGIDTDVPLVGRW